MSTGTKHDSDKNRLDLVPSEAIEALGEVVTFGSRKYDSHNWRKGIDYGRLFGACLRHLMEWNRGEDNDLESGLNHISHAMCNLTFLSTFIREGRCELDDRYIKGAGSGN